jgi:hypothetical protein
MGTGEMDPTIPRAIPRQVGICSRNIHTNRVRPSASGVSCGYEKRVRHTFLDVRCDHPKPTIVESNRGGKDAKRRPSLRQAQVELSSPIEHIANLDPIDEIL